MRKLILGIVIIFSNLIYISATSLDTTVVERSSDRKWYIPSHLTLNFIGHQGLYAVGTGISFYKQRMYLELTIGWTPESVAGVDLTSVHLKYTYQIFRMKFQEPKNLELYPLNLTFFLNKSRFVSEGRMHKSLYPGHYYWWMNNTRLQFGFGQSWKYYFNNENSRALMLYYELVTHDLYIHAYTQNKLVELNDIFFFGCGLRYFFK